jgi:hypothetical protein
VERKKNRFDPISNPVMFFREDPNRAPALQDKFLQKTLKPPKTSNVYKESGYLLNQRRTTTPVLNLKEKDKLLVLKNGIMEQIVRGRLYKDDDLENLFGRIRKANSHINTEIVEKAIKQIQDDF